MPILNPQQAYNLIKNTNNSFDSLLPFLKSLLQIASDHYCNDLKNMQIYNQFLDFVGHKTKQIADFFNIGPYMKTFANLDNCNAYSLLINMIQSNKESDTKNKSFETYLLNFSGLLKQTVSNTKVNIPEDESFFYTPYYSQTFGWYISDKSYAVLVFNFDKSSRSNENEIFKMKLSTYLIAACGYTLVACILNNDNYYFHFPNWLKPNFFSETHIFAEISKEKPDDFDPKYFVYPNIGYVYLYAHFNLFSEKYREDLEKCNNNNVKVFFLSKEIQSVFHDPNSLQKENSNFIATVTDLSGFVKRVIPINLCNVALYDTENRNEKWIPIKISGIAYGSMSAKDFQFSKTRRVQVKIDQDYYYVEFPEIHLMNPELYVSQPMYLTKQNVNIDIVEKINKTYKDKTALFQKSKVKNSNIKSNIEYKMHNAFHYLYKYTEYYDKEEKKQKHIEPYTSQIYAVYQAISFLGRANFKNKGIVLQVHTGEGKSFIVQALAEQLARQGNTVHIATSNIILAARDFEKAYGYYVNCEKKAHTILSKPQRPSILLHQHELQYINEFLNSHKIDDMPEKELFYGLDNFKNSTSMNLTVCEQNEKKKYYSNIIYSTFLNFEAFFLSQSEKDPYHIPNYISNCYLIIDEADTILIDELTNGTILSKPMKSNAVEVLNFVYQNYKSKDDAPKILELIKTNFPECKNDINIDHVNRMFSDIDKVRSKNFTIGKAYTIINDPIEPDIEKVVPFDSEHKGIAEPNKEFSGFVHQFTGIKEKTANPEKYKNLRIQPLSLNYLFISHPTYVRKYKGVCGVTGTIGDKREQELLQTYYGLVTQKVPRHQMNLRKDLPTILCESINDRNQKICFEIEIFHKMNCPVLIVFNDIIELSNVRKMLEDSYDVDKTKIHEFNGTDMEKNESSKNFIEENAGISGAITFGTNFCGRGVSIEHKSKPLHVIVTFYKKDKRSIKQALGRAGRNGNPGTTRIICTKEMFWAGAESPNERAMINIIKEFDVKNTMQLKFMEDMRSLFPWIFDENEMKDRIDRDDAFKLRNTVININRITAFNFKFPVCMSIETFIKIQIQRIFSIKNCPECKYSWYLFRIYMRELILESWSLFLDNIDVDFKKYKKENHLDKNSDPEEIAMHYNEFFDEKYDEFTNLLNLYLPHYEEKYSITETFFHIHDKVVNVWEDTIKANYEDSLRMDSLIFGKNNSYTSLKVGVFPISITDNTGSRITSDSSDDSELKTSILISDPELRYIKKGLNPGPFSISKILDKIFDSFQEIVDTKLKNLFGIRFFLRRTLAGCEFGVCLDLHRKNHNRYLNCLIDMDPLLLFTICTKSSYFWMGGILLMVLVFFTSICKLIATKYLKVGEIGEGIVKLIKLGWKKLTSPKEEKEEEKGTSIISNAINTVLDGIIAFLYDKIMKNIDIKIHSDEEDEGIKKKIFTYLLDMFFAPDTKTIGQVLGDRFFQKFKLNEKAKSIIDSESPMCKLIKIGILLIIILAQFITNFRYKKAVKFRDAKNEASVYQREMKKYPGVEMKYFDSYEKAEDILKKDIEKNYT